ncbi:MAG: TetR/AcrR family transcriptional regulator [Candidatus Binatia bacterium]
MAAGKKTPVPRPSTPPRRRPGADARTERTRAAIREAANALFLAKGVDETTVDEICENAGISKGTFYLYFHRKEDLLLEYGLQRLRRVREMVPDLIGQGSFRDAMEAIVDEVVRGKGWGREVAGRAILEMGNSAERLPMQTPPKVIQPLIEVAQARGELRTDIPSDALAHFVLRSILGALRDWGLGNDATDRDAALGVALTLVYDALAVRK